MGLLLLYQLIKLYVIVPTTFVFVKRYRMQFFYWFKSLKCPHKNTYFCINTPIAIYKQACICLIPLSLYHEHKYVHDLVTPIVICKQACICLIPLSLYHEQKHVHDLVAPIAICKQACICLIPLSLYDYY